MASNQAPDLTLGSANVLQNFVVHSSGTPDPTVLMSAITDDEHRRREQEKLELQAYFSGGGSAR
jgi:hypothetical protein